MLEIVSNLLNSILNIVDAQQKQINDLKEQLSTNSKNSSKPPSSDFKRSKKKQKAKKKSKNKQGAQPGHPGTFRKLEDSEVVNNIVDCKPQAYCICSGQIIVDNQYRRWQAYDIHTDTKTLILTEYRIFKGVCSLCSMSYKAKLPDDQDNTIIGANLKSLMSILVSDFKFSKRKIVEFLNLFYSLKLSLGTVSNNESRVSKALEVSYDLLSKAAKKSRT